MKLNLGCRDDLREGYINVDLYHYGDGITIADCVTLEGYCEDNSVEEILALSLLEHLTYPDAVLALSVWHSVMKPGAELIIETPDMEWWVQYYATNPKVALRRLFGPQDDDGQFHKSGWTFPILKEELEKAGFVNVRREKLDNDDMRIVCQKK